MCRTSSFVSVSSAGRSVLVLCALVVVGGGGVVAVTGEKTEGKTEEPSIKRENSGENRRTINKKGKQWGKQKNHQ